MSNLARAKKEKNDEFYTQIEDITNEMNAYYEYNHDVFRGKTLLCPCDDPSISKFVNYFCANFDKFGLKKLIFTSYTSPDNYRVVTEQEKKSPYFDAEKHAFNGKLFILDKDSNNDLEFRGYLQGNGDFRSDEVTRLRDEADIIITNPPFSLFREMVQWIMEANKQFSLVGNMNAIHYHVVFPLIKANKIWLGYEHPSEFNTPDGMTKKVLCRWFTNLEFDRHHEPYGCASMAYNLRHSSRLQKKIKSLGGDGSSYLKYDNYDAIDVPIVDCIPSDYDGVMGVPITYLDKYCPEQFEIIGLSLKDCHDDFPVTKTYDSYWEMTQSGTRTGSKGGKTNDNANIACNDGKHNYFINDEGKTVQACFARIFIRNKHPETKH